jgi:hypothetical protein|tara:strand:- start:850 stop:1395 length:546 start_codon:yes stop_codon:yes gene_type:complete
MQEVEIKYIKGVYPVFCTFLNNSPSVLDDLKEKIIKYREKYPKPNSSNVKAWHSHWDTFKFSNCFDDINIQILNRCKEIISEYENPKTTIIRNMWVNMYDEGDYTLEHIHLPAPFSCCYYVDVEDNCSPINFPPDLQITPKNDMLLVFGGNLYHEVPPTRGKRILISINLQQGPNFNFTYS